MKPQFQHLSRLPKARRWTSINGSDQLPGLVASLFGQNVRPQYSDMQKAMGYGNALDTTHPAAKLPLRKLPFFRAPAIGVNIYPSALLMRYARPYGQLPFLTWSDRVEKAREEGFTVVVRQGRPVLAQKVDGRPPLIYTSTDQVYPKNLPVPISVRYATPKGPFLHHALKATARRVPMAHANATSKKRVGALAFVRSKVAKRLMEALHLITTRGAQVVDGPADGLPRCRRSGWTYIFYHTSSMYNMPLTELIPQVRLCLEKVNAHAKKMDNAWLAEALLQNKLPPKSTPQIPFPGPITQTVVGINPNAPELCYENASRMHEVNEDKRPASTLGRIPPSSTGKKPQDVWEMELAAGLAILRKSSQ
ncbi:hypothetical protein D9619_003559 [Psilocybe cf. subviscida]|uniref:Uncharacterized protein n=1 Tax=Psilocybe cf. subviscida TaxID=2480587 RepID=A0A8H5EUR1_9AGAR|nr:hypothetical protein D9619_003559 [Psilocybe cf. subviscida]